MNTSLPRPIVEDDSSLQRRKSRMVTWLVALSLMGYPLLGTLVALTPFPSLVGSVPLRLAVVFLSLYLLVSMRRFPVTPVRVVLLLFWFVYVCRLIWDWQVAQIPEAESALLFLSVVGLLPALALLGMAPRHWDAHAFAKIAFFTGAATCTIAVLATLLGLGGERSLIEQTGRLSFDTVNPISYGHVAVTTLLTGLVGWSDNARRPLMLAVVVTGSIAALVCLQLAASKGPVVALVVCILALGVFKPRYRWMLFALSPVATLFLFFADDSNLTQRFSGAEEDLSTILRRELLDNAITQFLQHPILGNAFVETEMQTYPHNPFVEAAMATGIIGVTLYALVIITCVTRLVGLLTRKGSLLLALVALQLLVGEHISGSLWASGNLWTSLAMIIAMTSYERQATTVSINHPTTLHANKLLTATAAP